MGSVVLVKAWEALGGPTQEYVGQSLSRPPTVDKGRYTGMLPSKASFSAVIPGGTVDSPDFLTSEKHKLNSQSALNAQIYNYILY